jgi:hypothetical protein
LQLAAIIEEIARREKIEGRVATGISGFAHGEQVVWSAKGKRFEQNSIHDGEHGGIQADSYAKGQNGGERKAGISGETSQREAQILPEHNVTGYQERKNCGDI